MYLCNKNLYLLYFILFIVTKTSIGQAQCTNSELSSIQSCGSKINKILSNIKSDWPTFSPFPTLNNTIIIELCDSYSKYLLCISPTYLNCGKFVKEVEDMMSIVGYVCVDQKAMFSEQSKCIANFMTFPNNGLRKCISFANETDKSLISETDQCKAYNDITNCVIPLVQSQCGDQFGDALLEFSKRLMKTINNGCEMTASGFLTRHKRAVRLDFKADFTCESPFVPVGQLCYYANATEVSEPESEDACKKNVNAGSLLGSIHSEDERTIVQNLMLQSGITDLWIGARHVNSTWFWLDGNQFNFYAWGLNEPDLSLRCVVQSASINYRWKTANCYPQVHAYFCKMAPPISCDLNTNPCQNSGTCVSNGGKDFCRCNSPFTGTFCSSLITCTPSPCKNDGQCVSTNNINSCSCPIGFNGTFCEINWAACESQPCQNNGRCSLTDTGYRCSCRMGFTGNNCQIDINECISSPCLNGGTCNNGANNFTCTCASGWTGTTCNTHVDECASSPCQNGGTCSDVVNGYRCSCPTGYSGNQCQTSASSCANNPCQNGATCQNLGSSFACTCPTGYTGTLCQSRINNCTPNPCLSGGTCTATTLAYTCLCSVGYTGSRCQSRIDFCSSSPCLNSGTCFSNTGGYACQCTTGYSGNNCQINNCLPNPCQNNGQCVATISGFTCSCATGYTGTLCSESAILACASSPCQNSGTCTSLSNSQYTCQCMTGWSGTNCETDANECLLQSPCLNGATCVNTAGSYYCMCASGFSGSNCGVRSNSPCLSNPCSNGGTCVTTADGYQCLCTSEYTGPSCAARLCQMNWKHYNNYCYTVSSNPVAQTNAKYVCSNQGSTLSSLHSANERDFVASLMTNSSVNRAWIGAEYKGSQFSWMDNTTWSYTSWVSGQPSVQSTGVCVSQDITGGRSLWQSENCNTLLPQVCKSVVKIFAYTNTACSSNPCQNGGTCSLVGDTYSCTCAAGFGDTNCQSTSNACTPNPCANNGLCKVVGMSPVCSCKQNYTAKSNCQIPCPSGWSWFIGRCYMAFSTAANFQTAVNSCSTKQGGSYLLYTESQDEFYYACTLANKMVSNIWIGLQNEQSTGKYRWAHGKYLDSNDYKAWGFNQPINQNVAKCVQSVGGQGCAWESTSCENLLKYVCKFDGSSS